MKTVNKLDYLYRKLVVKAREQHDETVDITDEEYAKHYEVESEPTPGSDIPIPGEEDPDHDYSQDYLTFEALEDGTFSFTINDLYYSTNNGATWKSLAAGTETELITAGTKVLWKSDDVIAYNQAMSIGTFSSTGKFNVSGNILSIMYNTDFNIKNIMPTLYGGYQVHADLFTDCNNLISAKNLILPIQLTSFCFDNMFMNCTNLTIAPELLATTLMNNCYDTMFYNCSSLKYIKCLAIDKTAKACLLNWVYGVSQSGTFIKHKDAIWDIGDSGIPAGWEVIDEVVPKEE